MIEISQENQIEYTRGTHLQKPITVYSDYEADPPEVADVTDSTFTLTIKKYSDDAVATLTKALTITDAPNGLILINLEPADLATAEPGNYVYDVKEVRPGGDTYQTIEVTRFVLKRELW